MEHAFDLLDILPAIQEINKFWVLTPAREDEEIARLQFPVQDVLPVQPTQPRAMWSPTHATNFGEM